ncbi:MAG: hypothetical protein JWO89_3570 [Verrucomicrobiaceae bacterium]|nr:hypothetical protein [Verrucomicrobiaceae bacterium]
MGPAEDPASAAFVEEMGLIFQAEGMPRIAGRIFGRLVLCGGPFSLSDLALKLKASRGSISTNTRLLESIGLIERTGVAGDRQGYYRLAPDPYTRLLEGSIQRIAKANETVRRAQLRVPRRQADAHARLDELADFYSKTATGFEAILEKFAALSKSRVRRSSSSL